MNVSICRNGEEIGEWPEEQVRSLFKVGRLLSTDHYWKEGMAEWAELSKMIKPPPPMAVSATAQKAQDIKKDVPPSAPRPASTKKALSKAPVKKPGNWFRTTALILFLFVMMCIGIVSLQDKLNKDNCYSHTIGNFAGSTYTVFTRNGSPERYAIHYTYTVDGVEYQGYENSLSYDPKDRDATDVYYNPFNPKESYLEKTNPTLALLFYVLGLIFGLTLLYQFYTGIRYVLSKSF
jgi:hypothetical protein